MKILTDIEIAQKASVQNIKAIADKLNIPEDNLELYGKNKAKIDCSFLNESDYKKGKLILVTAINPTPAGEGKTTTTIGLADALRKIGKNSVVAMREPSLGPVFGVKGGATGGGYAQVVPMEDINLHFTGDFHAIGAANNLLAAMIDNHIYQGNELGIDPERITWKRCVDMNDRQLRVIRDGLGGSTNGVPRSDGYDITVASEIMAVFCLAKSLSDFKTRLARIIIGYNFDGNPVTAGDLGAVGAMAALLKDAIKPNLVQTLEGTPAIIHGGPFANIAHGCNSLIATETALKLADYTVTEAGFGADLGAQKFFDIKCRQSGLAPNAVVLVATVRALKMHGGVEKTKLTEENISALKCGLENLYKHFENITKVYKLPCIVALNHFYNDLESEVGVVKSECLNKQIPLAISKAWELGGVGAIELAEEVVKLCEQDSNFTLCYENSLTIDQKILAVAKRIYGADGIDVLDNAKEQIAKLTDLGFGNLPVCIAKTQYSFSDKPELLGAPKNFNLTIKDIKVSAGAGFIVVLTGNILTMPGLPKEPAAKRIDIDENGKISGLF